MIYTKEELYEAKRQISSVISKTEGVIKTFEGKPNPSRYKSQITLAKRRLAAFNIANHLIDEQLNSDD